MIMGACISAVCDNHMQRRTQSCRPVIRKTCARSTWVSRLLVPGEENGDGCSGGERDEDYGCDNSLLRSIYRWS